MCSLCIFCVRLCDRFTVWMKLFSAAGINENVCVNGFLCKEMCKKGVYDQVDVYLNLFDCTVVLHHSTIVQICKIYMILFKDDY